MRIDGHSLVYESVETLDCCNGNARRVIYTNGFETQHNHERTDCPVLLAHKEKFGFNRIYFTL